MEGQKKVAEAGEDEEGCEGRKKEGKGELQPSRFSPRLKIAAIHLRTALRLGGQPWHASRVRDVPSGYSD